MLLRLPLAVLLGASLAGSATGQSPPCPDTLLVRSGALQLHALLYRPPGPGPFPAVLFNHGSGQGVLGPSGELEHPMEWQADVLGPVFVRHGYVLLYPLRRGTGLSAGQGRLSSAQWDSALTANGPDARNRLQVELLETADLQDALASLAALRALPSVDPHRVAVAGHSFGGSLTLLLAERDSTLRGAIVFSGSARSWPLSPPLRQRLLTAVDRSVVPTYLIFAANDYSVAPARALDAELTRLGKAHRLTIFPAVGHTPREGHGFVHLRISVWEPAVFQFLDSLAQ